ncbi:MAG: hypothetical protein RRA45_05985 [Saccharolobus sp.]|jgi:hypothetical protein|uniref:hypothetical protein n=1 Tax=Saccharolobus sp. TaxID=2100761 RepID=UPI0028CCD927|nr:hypothetical protein [Saccharolobus sp.]MDT7861744.1 hypothetical protein [Saccharolobus sp.]
MDERLFKEYEKLRRILGDNLIEIEIVNNEVLVYVKNKVNLEGYKVLDAIDYAREEIYNSLGTIVKEIKVKGNTLEVYVKDYTPQMFEIVAVIEYEVNKKFGTNIVVKII